VIFDDLDLHIERGDRIALVGPNGSGKSTLMRLLSGAEAPDVGARTEGHNVVMQYFAQDEAARLDPVPTVYETLASGSAHNMVPAIRHILGGFLFSGDDVHKRVRVLSGGERTRLAVARMLLRPSNTLLLDEPTNHLDLDSKDVLLDALADYGGTLIFVSHDRYFVERLATRIIEVGGGTATSYPGTYQEFLWHKAHPGTESSGSDGVLENRADAPSSTAAARARKSRKPVRKPAVAGTSQVPSREERKRADAEARKTARAVRSRRARIEQLEARIAEAENSIRQLERAMAADGFYDDRTAAQPTIDRHQALMWEVGNLMSQWEALHDAPLSPLSDS
jgi:ATP-binding cassette subfamily F protein 3